MLLKNKSLKSKIWIYLIIFSILILSFLWFFQVIFLDNFYKWSKTNNIKKIGEQIKENYSSSNFNDKLDLITFENDVCIEINNDNNIIYTSNSFRKGCFDELRDPAHIGLKNEFKNSKLTEKTYDLMNPRFNNKTIILAIKLNNTTYAFITTSIEPLGFITSTFAKQLIIVTIIVLILSFIIGYFISKKIANPISKINKETKKMTELNANFNIKSDINEINELATTLSNTQNELSKTETLRRELMANVSHDLKTPLTMIKAYAEMVRDLTYKSKEKRENNLNVIIEEADRLNLLVNDILELSKMQSGIDELKIEEINLTEVINSIIKRFDILVDKKEVDFKINISKNYTIKADKKKIEQVIYNLINNATCYASIITINVFEKNNKIRIEIIDNGSGIKQEDLKLIWDKYYKTDKTHKREIKGTGLGLSIVKNIFIKHKFTYGIESELNKGTMFWFEI